MSNADMDAVICNADTRNAQCRHQPKSYAPYYKSMEMCMPSWACCTCIPSLQSYFCSLTVWELRLEKLRDTATSQLCIFFQMTGMWKWHRLTAVQNFCFKYKIKLSGTRLRNSCKQRLDHNHILLTRGNKTCRYQENTPAKKTCGGKVTALVKCACSVPRRGAKVEGGHFHVTIQVQEICWLGSKTQNQSCHAKTTSHSVGLQREPNFAEL